MPTKRPRRVLNDQEGSLAATARVSLTSLPIEILAEILLCTCSPPTVLAISRTCSFLYRSLTQNPAVSFIWRGVRKTCEPVPIPDPGDDWKKSEADYAAFVFGGGVCEVCQKTTRAMYVSFSARIRLCGSWHCRSRYLSEFLVDVTSELQGEDRQSLWVPPVESMRCFYPSRIMSPTWPHGEILFRKRDWVGFQRDLKAYKNAEHAQAEGEEDESRKRLLERCRVAKQRLPQIMEVSERLIHWKWRYDSVFKAMKKQNDTWTKDLAESEGWNLEDLAASQVYGSLQRRKTFLLEMTGPNDVSLIRSAIESELLTLKARHQRQKAEATYKTKLIEIKKIYERMRCGTLGISETESSSSNDPLALPPLSVFCTLPSVCALKGSPDPSVLPSSNNNFSDTSDINSPLAISLIRTDIHAWLIPVQKHLLTLLGYPNGWQSASTRTVHPLKRITARFFCRRCGEGKVGRGYRRERCLDFRGVCSHVCVGAPGKNLEGRRAEAPRGSESETDEGSGNQPEKGEGKGKGKSGEKMPDWKADMFERDNKAISFIQTVAKLTRLSEERSITPSGLGTMGFTVRCLTCKGWIVMDFETAIGHVHRHESMKIGILATSVPSYGGPLGKDGSSSHENGDHPVPTSRLVFERGNAELLLGPSYRSRKLWKQVNYGCKHCFVVEGVNMIVGIGQGTRGNEPRVMSFNGLRSHVKEKHGIRDLGDEDFFCYASIRNEGRKSRRG